MHITVYQDISLSSEARGGYFGLLGWRAKNRAKISAVRAASHGGTKSGRAVNDHKACGGKRCRLPAGHVRRVLPISGAGGYGES